MLPNGCSHGIPQRGQRRTSRARHLRRCPHDGHFFHSDSRAFAESCAELTQPFIFLNRKNLQSVRKDGCPGCGASVLAHIGLQKKKLLGNMAEALAEASDKSEFGSGGGCPRSKSRKREAASWGAASCRAVCPSPWRGWKPHLPSRHPGFSRVSCMVRLAGRGRPPGGPSWASLSHGPPGGRALPEEAAGKKPRGCRSLESSAPDGLRFHGRHNAEIPMETLDFSVISQLVFAMRRMTRPRVGADRPETFFQSLENCRKFFPIIGKTGTIFPTIGKKFSNRWKTRALPRSDRIVRPHPLQAIWTAGPGPGQRVRETARGAKHGGKTPICPMPPLERFKKCCSRFGRAALCRGRVQGRKTRPGRSRALPGLRLHFFLICSRAVSGIERFKK